MNTWTCTRQGELYHHGIKGQKWGVRRFQNKDGSLTPAGKKRYDEPNIGRNRNAKDENNGKKQKTYKIPENKSLHRLKLEEKYMKNGMTREEAEQAAAKRIRTEKFVAAAAVVTVASAVAYAKYKGYTSDKIIKENSDFQRIMRLDPNAELRKDSRLYATIDKKDKVLYKGMFADHLNQMKSDNEKIYDITVRNRKEIRIASEKRARDTFVDLFKNDKNFKSEFIERLEKDGYEVSKGRLDGIFNKMLKDSNSLSDRELRGKAYDLFNVMLAEQGERTERNANRFYDALRKQGINAIKDINDSKINNYNAKLPVILFDTDYDYVKKRVMEASEIQENIDRYINLSSKSSNMAIAASLVGMYASIPVYNKATVDKQVLLYKQAHPNTTMSDAEIKTMIKEELQKGGEKSK